MCGRCGVFLHTAVLEKKLSGLRTGEARIYPAVCDAHSLQSPQGQTNSAWRSLQADWSSRAVSQARAPLIHISIGKGVGLLHRSLFTVSLSSFRISILPLSLYLCLLNLISICSFLRSASDTLFEYSNADD